MRVFTFLKRLDTILNRTELKSLFSSSFQTVMLLIQLSLFFVNVQHAESNMDTNNVRTQKYALCPPGSVFNGQELFSAQGGSLLDCVKRCTETAGCVAVNVCPSGHSKQTACGFLAEPNPGGCSSLDSGSSPKCLFAQKVCGTSCLCSLIN